MLDIVLATHVRGLSQATFEDPTGNRRTKRDRERPSSRIGRYQHGHLLRAEVGSVVHELLEAEAAHLTGAGRGERTNERVMNLEGFRPRAWEPRVGQIDLPIEDEGSARFRAAGRAAARRTRR